MSHLAEVIDKLVLFRQVLNLAYVERDSARVAEAEATAEPEPEPEPEPELEEEE